MRYVWCNKEQCRIPAFRCLLCDKGCYSQQSDPGGAAQALEILLKSGKYEERWVMKRKEKTAAKELPAELEDASNSDQKGPEEGPAKAREGDLFLLENGKLQPFSTDNYTESILYQMVESYSVECKLVRPEDPANLIYDGKRPSKKTLPIVLTKSGESLLLESWEALEAKPEQLANADEVIGAMPVKQVFVLKKN
jgi:hypothetical protein